MDSGLTGRQLISRTRRSESRPAARMDWSVPSAVAQELRGPGGHGEHEQDQETRADESGRADAEVLGECAEGKGSERHDPDGKFLDAQSAAVKGSLGGH